jgi:hypothetical protein
MATYKFLIYALLNLNNVDDGKCDFSSYAGPYIAILPRLKGLSSDESHRSKSHGGFYRTACAYPCQYTLVRRRTNFWYFDEALWFSKLVHPDASALQRC